jgi:hypothetical protein
MIPNDCDKVPKVTCHVLRAIQKISKSRVQTKLVKEQIRFRHHTQGALGGRGGGGGGGGEREEGKEEKKEIEDKQEKVKEEM